MVIRNRPWEKTDGLHPSFRGGGRCDRYRAWYRAVSWTILLGCRRIDYGERMGYFPACDLVVSATASPNFTLKEENVRPVDLDHDLIVVDLAVPRDVEPGVGKLRHIRLYDIDDFHVDARSEQVIENLKKAERSSKSRGKSLTAGTSAGIWCRGSRS